MTFTALTLVRFALITVALVLATLAVRGFEPASAPALFAAAAVICACHVVLGRPLYVVARMLLFPSYRLTLFAFHVVVLLCGLALAGFLAEEVLDEPGGAATFGIAVGTVIATQILFRPLIVAAAEWLRGPTIWFFGALANTAFAAFAAAIAGAYELAVVVDGFAAALTTGLCITAIVGAGFAVINALRDEDDELDDFDD